MRNPTLDIPHSTMLTLFLVGALVLAVLAIAGCNFTCIKPGITGEPSDETFETLSEKVFTPRCVACHRAGQAIGDFATYEGVMRYVVKNNSAESKLCQTLLLAKMPPGSPLSTEDSQEVCKWIDSGALES